MLYIHDFGEIAEQVLYRRVRNINQRNQRLILLHLFTIHKFNNASATVAFVDNKIKGSKIISTTLPFTNPNERSESLSCYNANPFYDNKLPQRFNKCEKNKNEERNKHILT